MNLFQRLEEVARVGPERTALVVHEASGYRRVTFRQVAQEARRVAGRLLAEGLKSGDRVALVSENRPEWTTAYFGIVGAGGVAVPLDVQLPEGEIANVLRHAGCRFVIASGKQSARLSAAPAGPAPPRILDLDADAAHGSAAGLRGAEPPSAAALPDVPADALASILYTSGTTGVPKGVMLSHANFLANVESVTRFRLIDQNDNLLALLPLHHAFPFMVQLMVVFTRACLTFPASLRGPDLLACMRDTGVTVLVGVPQLFYMLHKGIFDEIGRRPLLVRLLLRGLLRLSGALRPSGPNLGRLIFGAVHRRFGGKIRLMVSGGARLDPAVMRDFLALGFVFSEGYGLTETAPVVAFNPLRRVKPGSVGIPLPGVEVRIEQPGAEGVGEIAIRGGNVMRGYYKQPEATAAVLRDGWFLSGDLGYLDPDGYLFITGRAKEVIVLSSGKNIYPEEVEQVYLQSPYIKEICLIPQTTGRAGAQVEGLLALVLPDLEFFRAKGMTNIAETIRWDMENVGKDLPAYKRPTDLRIVKEGFPRTRLGKIQRHLVQERHRAETPEAAAADAAALPDADLALLDDPAGRGVVDYLRRASEKPVVRLDDNLELDLGLDSLSRVEMFVALEAALGVKIPDEAAAECFTVREVIEKVRAVRGAAAAAPVARTSWQEILSAPASPEVEELVASSRSLSTRIISGVTRAICAAVLRTVYRLRVEGRANVPAAGPVILVANHTSYFDAFVLAAALPPRAARQVFYMGFEWFFRHPVLAWWARGVRVIPVDMDSYLIRALQASARVLRDGQVLCLFPEGERSATGALRPFRKGTGILVRELKVPVLPAVISGAFEAWPRGQTLPRIHPLRVRFGPPISAEELLSGDGPRGADDAETAVLRLHARVARLAGEK
ncbi:MAG: AMP-binding protein [Candidatus Methylomirabilales bacterium]